MYAARRTPACLQPTLHHRRELVDVGVGQLRKRRPAPLFLLRPCRNLWPGRRIQRVADLTALADPVARVDVPPVDHVLRAGVPLELGREFGEGKLLVVDQLQIPHRMKVGRLAEPAHLDLVGAAVAAFADVERLVEVADEVDDEAQRELLVRKARFGILKDRAEMAERLQRIAFARRMVVDDPVERHIMPRRRGLLPERRRVGAHLVRPGRRLVEALGAAENFLHMRTRKPAELGVGDCRNHAVPGLAPGEGGRWREQPQRNDGKRRQATSALMAADHWSGLSRIRPAGACPARAA